MPDNESNLSSGERRRRQLRASSLRIAMNDLAGAFLGSPVWWYLAWQDIRQRYRRSVLGPFWLTASTGIMLAAMGPLYGVLFKQPLNSYFQHLSLSFVVWTFVASAITESCTAYITAEGFIKEVGLPYTTHITRVLVRNVIVFGHNLLVVVIVLMVFPPEVWVRCLLAVPGLLLVTINLFWIGSILALVSTRFRDIPQIVVAVVQVAFFLTPVVWKSEMLGDHEGITVYNPLYHLVEVVRTPLLGKHPQSISWVVLSVSAIVGPVIAMYVFGRFRSRIAYWV